MLSIISRRVLRALPKRFRKFSTTKSACSPILKYSPNAQLNKNILDKYLCLPTPETKCQVKYVWIDGTGENVRSKTRTLNFVPTNVEEIPRWTYDGSSTFQARGENSDTFLVPAALYKDPFRRGNNKIVLCETYDSEMHPTVTNHRCACAEAIGKICDKKPQFGIEQEYQLMDMEGRPFGWPHPLGQPDLAGPYYCGVGADKAYGRDIVEAHYRACLYAGVMIEGSNAEVTLAQWEFQVGVCNGIKAADDTWMARFMLWRIAEEFGVCVSLHPKIIPNWNGAGCHTNFSTSEMRNEGGLEIIEACMEKLEKNHSKHMERYDPKGGEYNKLRLTGGHETSSLEDFSWAVANRGASVRIGREVAEKKKGYFEDRRPASNCDPYAVCDAIVRTCCLDE